MTSSTSSGHLPVLALGVALVAAPTAATAQMAKPHAAPTNAPVAVTATPHAMASLGFGRGWRLSAMAQAFPIGTSGEDPGAAGPLGERAIYLTQPAIMLDLASPGSLVSLRTTLNLEGWTQPDGELTYGAWGEGFIDRRHPHTLLHEAMLTVRFPSVPGGSFSLAAGKGFAPYGTEDPMGRPVVKFPTNHHLSQVVERYVAIAAYRLNGGASLELGVFGGSEPKGVYDFSNIKDFGNSFSARVTQRLGGGTVGASPWEIGASYARIAERHHDATAVTHLKNVSVRYEVPQVTALAEASHGSQAEGENYWSVLAEARLALGRSGRHQPYLRSELSTRPEYQREGAPGTDGFFRYDHDHAQLSGATRWFVQTIGYGVSLGSYPVRAMPFVEIQRLEVRSVRGGVEPRALFGRDGFWAASVGTRLFIGGGAMRMGNYGVATAAGLGGHAHTAAAVPLTMGGEHGHH